MKAWLYSLVVFSFVFVCTIVFGADFVVPEGDPLASLFLLFTSWKVSAPLAIGSTAIVIIVQACRRFFPSSAVANIAVAALSVAYTVIQKVLNGGMSIGSALVYVLITAGGAAFLYNFVLKPIFKKLPEGSFLNPGNKLS